MRARSLSSSIDITLRESTQKKSKSRGHERRDFYLTFFFGLRDSWTCRLALFAMPKPRKNELTCQTWTNRRQENEKRRRRETIHREATSITSRAERLLIVTPFTSGLHSGGFRRIYNNERESINLIICATLWVTQFHAAVLSAPLDRSRSASVLASKKNWNGNLIPFSSICLNASIYHVILPCAVPLFKFLPPSLTVSQETDETPFTVFSCFAGFRDDLDEKSWANNKKSFCCSFANRNQIDRWAICDEEWVQQQEGKKKNLLNGNQALL